MKATQTVGLWLVAIMIACSAAAADQTSREVAQELVNLTLGGTANDMIAKMTTAMWPSVQATLPKTLDNATVAELHAEFDRVVRKYVGEAMKVAPDIYARHFSADELRGLLAFYQTPLGAKALAEMPKLMGDFSSSALMPMMAPMMNETKTNIDGILRAHGLTPAK